MKKVKKYRRVHPFGTDYNGTSAHFYMPDLNETIVLPESLLTKLKTDKDGFLLLPEETFAKYEHF